MVLQKVKDIARSMIMASHYNQLPDSEFESYLKSVRAVTLREVAEHLENYPEDFLDYDRRWQFINRLRAGILP